MVCLFVFQKNAPMGGGNVIKVATTSGQMMSTGLMR